MPFVELGQRKLLFVHIPKTGGTALTEWLGGFGPVHLHSNGKPMGALTTPQHLRWADIACFFAKGYFDHRFTVVRNPYDRIESEYRYRQAPAGRSSHQSVERFSTWLERHIKQAGAVPHHLDNHIRPQVDFIGGGVQVYHYEDGLDAIAARIAEEIGSPSPGSLPRLRVVKNPPQIEWDLQDRLLVNRFYAEDFDRFGYRRID